MLRGTTGMLAALLLALPLANGAASSYCGCTKTRRDNTDTYKDAEYPHTGVSRGKEYCEDKSTNTCYEPPTSSGPCTKGGSARCNYSVACANAMTEGKACQTKHFRIRFTKGKTLVSDSDLRELRSDVQKALNDKLNAGYVEYSSSMSADDKLKNYEKLNFYLNVDTYPRQKSGYNKSTGRRLLEEDEIELDLFDDEEDVEIPRRRRLQYRSRRRNASPTKKPNSMKSKYKQYTYVKVEIQGPWADKASINQKEIETLITTRTKSFMNCCKAVTFYKICEGLNCKSDQCDEGSDCNKDSGGSTVVLIVIVVLVVCCCCCAAAVGAYFYMNQKNENLNKELETQNDNSTPRGNEGAGGPNSTNAVTQGAPDEAI